MSYFIGVDIGGTKTAMGIVDKEGTILAKKIIPTNLAVSPEQMIRDICNDLNELINQTPLSIKEIEGIGIGAPGPLDPAKGEITSPPNLPNWINIRIVDIFKEYFELPVILENDANAATLGEKWVGAAQNNNHFVYMTISTGIGAGLFLDGNLVTGTRGNAGEIGHVVVDPSYGKCKCGQLGCLEHIASGTSIARIASEKLKRTLTTKEVFELYEAEHKDIVPLIDAIFQKIGIGCVALINMFDPEKIVIGGGVSNVGEPLFQSLRDYVSKYALNPAGRETEIVPSGLNQDTGIIGAAALILKMRNYI